MRRKNITETEDNQDEIRAIRYFDSLLLSTIALFFVCIVGQCSAEQLFRWLLEFEPNENECLKAISDLKGKCFINKLSIGALKTLGLGVEIIIYFATDKARQEMEKTVALPSVISHDGLLMMKQFIFDEPTGHRLDRVWHQLLCAESILSLLIKHYFCWFRSESQLQAEKKRHNNQLIRIHHNDTTKPKPYINYKTGDYEIHLLDKATFYRDTFECEIAHKMTLKQLKQKPPTISKYFCLNEWEANLVSEARERVNVTVLESDIFFEPRFVRETLKKELYSKNTEPNSQQEILKLTHHLGGIVTARLIAQYTVKKQDFCRSQLTQLCKQGYLIKINSCLKPGISRGRNITFYCQNDINIDSKLTLRSGILRCYALMTKLKTLTYIKYIYAVDGIVVVLRNKEVLFISDNEKETPDENLERFHQIQLDYPSYRLAIIGLEMWRLNIYKTQKIGHICLSDLDESKSYREKLD